MTAMLRACVGWMMAEVTVSIRESPAARSTDVATNRPWASNPPSTLIVVPGAWRGVLANSSFTSGKPARRSP